MGKYIDAKTPAVFYAALKNAPKSVVDFHATWCGPCVNIAPYVEKKCEEKGVQLIKVDVDQN